MHDCLVLKERTKSYTMLRVVFCLEGFNYFSILSIYLWASDLKYSIFLYINTILENIALNKPAWQEYPFNNEWVAGLAVDGRKSDRDANGGQCTISENGKSTAMWRVDLEIVNSIHHIFIQFRTANVPWGNPFI